MISPELLRRYTYFAGARDESLKRIAMAADEVSCTEGDTLFQEGQPANRLYVITRGEMDVQFVLQSGERRVVDTLVAGDLVLWSAVVEPFRSTAACVARIDTRLIAIDATTLRQLIDEDRELGYTLMKEVAKVTSHRLAGARIQLAAIG